MARLGSAKKTPGERKRYTITFADWLDESETLLTKAFEVQGSDDDLEVDASEFAAANLSVVFFVSGGNDGETYTVILTVTTSGGQTKEVWIYFHVKEP